MKSLFNNLRLLYLSWSGLRRFNRLDRAMKRFVFYAESAADWAFLGPVVQSLMRSGEPVVRVTSDISDPLLEEATTYYIGNGSARTVFFQTIDADEFIMTLTDLDTFHLKRSVNKVHYCYVFHSIASTHRVYRERAFDAYDTIFAVGPHHIKEISKREEGYGLKPKCIVPIGYQRLDTIMNAVAKNQGHSKKHDALNVLLAPSWGECSIVHHCLEDTVEILISSGMRVTLRLHPMTVRHFPKLSGQLTSRFGRSGLFHFDAHINTTDSFVEADIMISEWSGAALEYAFSKERPVIFIDTPPKVNNKNYAALDLPCFEDYIRFELGKVVGMDDLKSLPVLIQDTLTKLDEWPERILKARQEFVFNVGNSADVAAQYLIDSH